MKKLFSIFGALVLALMLTSIVAQAASVTPDFRDQWESGNAANECAVVGSFDHAYKFEEDEDAWDFSITHEGNDILVSPNNLVGEFTAFDWTASKGIAAVIVKGGTVANLFNYSLATSDTNLYAPTNPANSQPFGVSHITFCWNDDEGNGNGEPGDEPIENDDQELCYVEGETKYASSVIDSDQGDQQNGQPVAPGRSNPEQGLVFEAAQNESSFFSLGFGGWIIVGFDNIIVDQTGNDLRITEDTWGEPYPIEKANVYVSQNGTDWMLLGEADNTNLNIIHTTKEFDLASISWSWAKYVKVVDTTDPDEFASIPNGDGYDLNAVEALHSGYLGPCIEEPELPTVYEADGRACPSETPVEKPVGEWTISSTEPNPINVELEAGQYLFRASGTYNYDKNVAGKFADAGYATLNNWDDTRIDIGILGTNQGVTSLLSDMGTRTMGVVNWGTYDSIDVTHTYNFLYTTTGSPVKFVISDWYDEWYSSQPGSNNQAAMNDNQGSLTLEVYKCVEEAVENPGCTYTQGYWKNHKTEWNDEIGPDDPFLEPNNEQTYLEVLNTPPAGKVYYQLAHQYIAAKLNVLNGADDSALGTNLEAAEELLQTKTPAETKKLKGAAKAEWITLAGILADFNEGKIGPGHCDESCDQPTCNLPTCGGCGGQVMIRNTNTQTTTTATAVANTGGNVGANQTGNATANASAKAKVNWVSFFGRR